jgi:hypothetical protein
MPEPALIPPIPPRLPERVTCRRCGRPLHDPVSRMLRLGRECRGPEEPVRVLAGEQDVLPGLPGSGEAPGVPPGRGREPDGTVPDRSP